jgi:hypothetical protein
VASRLGTQLVRSGYITPQHLEEALRVQVIYGGRLGTNLVELGHINVDQLAEALSKVVGFPPATAELFEAADEKTLKTIPPDVAEKHECFPLKLDGRKLHMAMINPQDIAAVDALSFKTGLRIVPYVVPEMRLFYYMEKRYGPRTTRR